MLVKDLTTSLQINLKANVCQSNSLVDQLYPASSHLFPIDDSLLEVLFKHDIWDHKQASFRKLPLNATKLDIADWLNKLGMEMGIPYWK
jgi:hypothetical protein